MNKFLFDKSFDRSKQKDKPTEPTFTQGELEVFKNVAYEEGYNKAHAAIEQQLLEIAQQISGKLDAVQKQQTDMNKKYRSIAHEIATTVIKAVLPGAVEQFGFEDVKQLIDKAFSKLSESEGISITVNPDLQDKVQEYIKGTHQEENFKVKANQEFSMTDCLVETQSGSMERYFESVWKDIEKILSDYYPGSKPKANDQDEQLTKQQGAE